MHERTSNSLIAWDVAVNAAGADAGGVRSWRTGGDRVRVGVDTGVRVAGGGVHVNGGGRFAQQLL